MKKLPYDILKIQQISYIFIIAVNQTLIVKSFIILP